MATNDESIPYNGQVPMEVWETVFHFCGRQELFNLLTVCSEFFPMVAKKLWDKRCLVFDYDFEDSEDYRACLFSKRTSTPPLLVSAPSLPYLKYVTELELIGGLDTKSEIFILQNTPHCDFLAISWSDALVSVLLNTKNVVPFLTHLCIATTADSKIYNAALETPELQTILEARKETLKILELRLGIFCVSQLLFTINSKTKLTRLINTFDYMVECLETCQFNSKSIIPTSSSLQYFSCGSRTLHIVPELDFFHWIHTSPKLTSFLMTFERYKLRYEENGIEQKFFHFLQTFPAVTPLNKFYLAYYYIDSSLDEPPPSVLDSVPLELNYSLKKLTFEFSMSVVSISYNLLNFMLDKFSGIKYLKLVGDPRPSFDEYSLHDQGALDEHRSLLTRLASLHLTKLFIDLPNNIQHFLLPTLKTMTLLNEIELRLNLDLLYSFITALPHITCFIFRPTKVIEKLQVCIDQKPIPLIRRKTEYHQYLYVFNKTQLDLIRNAPLKSVKFESGEV